MHAAEVISSHTLRKKNGRKHRKKWSLPVVTLPMVRITFNQHVVHKHWGNNANKNFTLLQPLLHQHGFHQALIPPCTLFYNALPSRTAAPPPLTWTRRNGSRPVPSVTPPMAVINFSLLQPLLHQRGFHQALIPPCTLFYNVLPSWTPPPPPPLTWTRRNGSRPVPSVTPPMVGITFKHHVHPIHRCNPICMTLRMRFPPARKVTLPMAGITPWTVLTYKLLLIITRRGPAPHMLHTLCRISNSQVPIRSYPGIDFLSCSRSCYASDNLLCVHVPCVLTVMWTTLKVACPWCSCNIQ